MSLDEMVEAFGGTISQRQAYALKIGRWMSRALAERPGSRERLARWGAAGCPLGPFGANVVTHGARTREIAAAVFARLPPPVGWFLSGHVLIVGIGRGRGFHQIAPRMAVAPAAEALHVAAIWNDCPGAGVNAALLAHECAHAWTSVVVQPENTRTTTEGAALRAERDRIVAGGAFPELMERIIADRGRDEELAHILSAEWGFGGTPASSLTWLRNYGVRAYVEKGIRDEVHAEGSPSNG